MAHRGDTLCEFGRQETPLMGAMGIIILVHGCEEQREQCPQSTSLLASGEPRAFQNATRSLWRKR